MAILGVVAAGRLRRGSSRSDTRFLAPYHLDGESVRLPLQCLAREGLVRLPLSGPPELAERGASAGRGGAILITVARPRRAARFDRGWCRRRGPRGLDAVAVSEGLGDQARTMSLILRSWATASCLS